MVCDMMKNYKLKIQYDGTKYSGWQFQNNSISVQQTITEALEVLTKEKIKYDFSFQRGFLENLEVKILRDIFGIKYFTEAMLALIRDIYNVYY